MRNFAMKVYSVEQRTRDFVHVALYLPRCADTGVRGVAIITAWTWVHGSHEHEATRILESIFGAADGDMAILQRLPEHFEC